jgi:uncharacterized protein YggE
MLRRILLLQFVACFSLLFAQLDSNSVTVFASRSSNQQPADQALIGASVNSSFSTSLDDVIAALQGSSITLANFVTVNTTTVYTDPPNPMPVQTLQWTFQLAIPLAKVKDTLTTLGNVQQALAKKGNGIAMSFGVQGAQAATQPDPSQSCSLTDLIADGRAQAQKLANAAGLSVGNILAMSSSVTSAISGAGSLGTRVTLPNCSLSIKFALLR